MMVYDFRKITLATWWGMIGKGRLEAGVAQWAVAVVQERDGFDNGSDGGPGGKLISL